MARESGQSERLLFILSNGLPVPNKPDITPPTDGRAPRESEPAALERVRRQIAGYKEMTFVTYGRGDAPEGKGRFVAEDVGGWRDLSELGRMAVIDHWVNFDGVSLPDRREVLLSEIDTSKLPAEVAQQLHSVPKESVFDRVTKGVAGRQAARNRDRDYEPE